MSPSQELPTTMPPGIVGIHAEPLAGTRGWREYRRTSGKLRWAIDREWIKEQGQWRKRGHHRRDVPPLTEEQYGHWKIIRAGARNAKCGDRAAGAERVREVAVGDTRALEVWGLVGARLARVECRTAETQTLELDSGDWCLVRVSGLPTTMVPGQLEGIVRFRRVVGKAVDESEAAVETAARRSE